MIFSKLSSNHVEPDRRALLIGICYKDGHQRSVNGMGPLNEPHRDVQACRKLLIDKIHYREENIVMMMDTKDSPPHLVPTRENILKQLEIFIKPAESNVQYFFLYAGHSDQLNCTDGTEEDGQNECLVPSDALHIVQSPTFQEEANAANWVIMDDELKRQLVDKLPKNSRLTALLDTCHSATLLDLHHHRCNRIVRLTASKRRIHRKFNEFMLRLRTAHSSAFGQALSHMHGIMRAYAIPEYTFCDGTHCLRLSTRGRPSVICI
ncbi:hypothetical protein VKT23_014096 [Stygiomarasmius scandens]|uniref:Peptidase C14 caspase domain-containing protein n=1 Tax=Marasmiellus scandens TaxID=2682957 RepID=A0ABR1J5Y1_9AGAR